jgi:hypothetical protein
MMPKDVMPRMASLQLKIFESSALTLPLVGRVDARERVGVGASFVLTL